MKIMYFKTKIYILLKLFNIVCGLQCSRSEDCDWCGVCIDEQGKSGKICFYPYPEIEVKNNKCFSKHETLCKDYVCQRGGKCLMDFGFSGPVCNCDYSYYFMGQNCEIEWDKANLDSWVSGIAILFDHRRKPRTSVEPYSISVFAAVYSSANNLQFYLETSEGYSIRFNKPNADLCSNTKQTKIYPYQPFCRLCEASLPKNCKLVFKSKVQFPYKVDPTEPSTVSKTGRVIGYMANLTVVAKTLNNFKYQDVLNQVYPVFVNYENLNEGARPLIIPVTLLNCGKRLKERVFYLRRSTISLRGAFIRFGGNPYSQLMTVWFIWDSEQFREEYLKPYLFQINKGFSMTIHPFTVKPGIYRVQLKTTNIYGSQSLTNYAECYFEVVRDNVKAIISGGRKITVNSNYQVIISGAKSYDPNEPKEKKHLQFFWNCEPHCNDLFRKFSNNYDQIVIPEDKMDFGKVYKFTLTVSAHGLNTGRGSAYQEIYVSDQDMFVYCLINCLDELVPSDPFLLEVKLTDNAQINHTFKWTKTDENGNEVAVASVKWDNQTFPSYLLYLGPNSLNPGEILYFEAQMSNTTAISGIQVHVGFKPNFFCSVVPPEGTLLITSFDVYCSKPEGDHTSWIFEFYDKFESDLDVEYSGRMIATNNLGVYKNFKISRGIIVIFLYDMSGFMSNSKQVIELSIYNATRKDIDVLFSEIETLIGFNKMEAALKKASLISDLIVIGTDKNYVAVRIVPLLCRISYTSQRIQKLGLLTVKNIISALTKEKDFKISMNMLKSLANLIYSLIQWTDYAMDLSTSAIPAITKGMMEQMVCVSIEAIEVLILNRNDSFVHARPEDLEPSGYEDALDASLNIERSLNAIGRALSFRQAAGNVMTSISSTSKLSSVVTYSDYLKIISKQVNENNSFPLKFSENLIAGLINVEALTIQLTSIKFNPFWTGRKDISTNLLNLELYTTHTVENELKPVDAESLNDEFDFFLEVLSSKISSVAITLTQYAPPAIEDNEDMDEKVTVLRLDLEHRGKLFVSFSFNNVNDEIKTIFSDKRPDYETVNKSSTVKNAGSPNWTYEYVGEQDLFMYLGMLPGSNVPVNEFINITVNFHYQACLTWHRNGWVSRYCRVGDATNTSVFHCRCSHLSFFSGVFLVPPNNVDPFMDISLFLTIKNNWLVVVFMTCLLLMFFLLGVWAKCNDAKDKVRRKVLVLEDNFPGDENYYLLAVFTGCRINAGTEANVGIKIYGSESTSRVHILRSSTRKVLKSNSEDWFMIQTPEPLGIVTVIHVWHDNSGKSPDWYCSKIVVYDLKASVVYTFFVEQWLALEVDEFCEAVVLTATSDEINDIRRIIKDNITFGFRDGDLSGSILARHPRSRIDRVDRVVILLNFTVVALLISLVFYNVALNYDTDGYDEFDFSVGTREIIISAETFIISSILIVVVSFTFTKAYQPKQKEREPTNTDSVYTRPPTSNPVSEANFKSGPPSPTLINKKEEMKTFYRSLVRRVRLTFNTLPFNPVTLSSSPKENKTSKICYCSAWILSFVSITCCVFFIILYGLKLGHQESKKWLASMSMVLVQEFLIMSPIKIVIIALMLASTFERFVQISNYNVSAKGFAVDIQPINETFFSNMLVTRKQEMYKPLRLTISGSVRTKRIMKRIFYNLLDLCILILFIIIIWLFTNDFSIYVHSRANLHVGQTVLTDNNPRRVNFQEVHNMTLYFNYMDRTFIDALYTIKWYNKKKINPPGLKYERLSKWWTTDKSTKLVGPPMFRQIRVDPGKCRSNRLVVNSSGACVPSWSPDVEDIEDYRYGWTVYAKEPARAGSNPWTYKRPSGTSRVSKQGGTWTTYHGGGYVASLSADKFETQRTLQNLYGGNWINLFTRVVFLDFTLFNVNRHMFTEVALTAEHLPFGLVVTRAMVNSVQLDMVRSGWNTIFIMFILMTVFHVIKTLWLMNRRGFINYITKLGNLYQIFVTCLGVVSIIFFVVHLRFSISYVTEFQRKGLDVFFEFYKIVYYSVISGDCVKVLQFCLSFQLFSLWPFGGNSLNIYQTLVSSGKTIARYQIVIFAYIFIFVRFFSYLLNLMLPYSAVFWLWSKSVYQISNLKGLLVLFVLSFSIKLCLVYILLLFIYNYKRGLREKLKASDFVLFLNWITRIIRRKLKNFP